MLEEIRLTRTGLVVAGLALCVAALGARAANAPPDPTLMLHYTFDQDPGNVAKDLSSHGHDGKIIKAQYLEEFNGRHGVLRFDGKDSVMTIPKANAPSLAEDLSFEFWIRQNGPIMNSTCNLFGSRSRMNFHYMGYVSLTLYYNYYNAEMKRHEPIPLPVDRNILSDKWSHIAIVVEYPRCKFYHNGNLVRDAYMPVPNRVAGRAELTLGKAMPIDLDEFRFYQRALTAAEVAAHAAGKKTGPDQEIELAVETHWYERTITLRLNSKGLDLAGHTAEMALLAGDDKEIVEPRQAMVLESSENSGRYVASVKFPLAGLEGKSLTGVARILPPDGGPEKVVRQQASLEKPEWVYTKEGYSDKVVTPWTPLEAREHTDGTVEVSVWGRRYVFGDAPFPKLIETGDRKILAAPVSLTGRIGGNAVTWTNRQVQLLKHTETAATLRHHSESEPLALSVGTHIEFDGYMIFDCELTARRDVKVDELRLDIPLHSEFAALCYANSVFPPTRENDRVNHIAMDHSGTVHGDQAFQFASVAWLGDGERGLCWQAESNEHWRTADMQKAIEVLPREKTTMFRARFIDVPTSIKQGDVLRYKFALQATPIKKKVRDAWDLRMVRFEPYGSELSLPDMTIDGKPALDMMAESGMRLGSYMVCDMWSYPMPVQEKFSKILVRFNQEVHARGMQAVGYQMHPRCSTGVPEFDIHGLHMVRRPMNAYSMGGAPPGTVRPGTINIDYGTNSQGVLSDCAKSMALQDALVHSFAKRMDTYGDDGVYLDGRIGAPACKNLLHGCGYRDEDGSIQKTYPVFAARQIMKRIYTVVKTRNPDGVVDAHSSYECNIPALAFSDLLWSGEQWWHFKLTGGPEDGYTSAIFPPDMCRVEYMGLQSGVAGNALLGRSGPTSKVLATTLLHDVPHRPSNPFPDHPQFAELRAERGRNNFDTIVQLWKMRDRFGAKEAQKFFYWDNQNYVTVTPEKCYATLFKHPSNGVLAIISNLRRDAQTVNAQFNLDELGLRGMMLDVFNALTNEPVDMMADGKISVPLGSEQWVYIWLRPTANQ